MSRISAVIVVALLAAGCASTVRYSQNPIGTARFLGIAVTDDAAQARATIESQGRELLPYPVYYRTDYKQLRTKPAVSLSFRGGQLGGRTWTSGLHEAMGLVTKDEPFVVLVLDRRGRVRGFSTELGASGGADPLDELHGLVEDLLLNLDGKEEIVHHGKEIRSNALVGFGSRTIVGMDDPEVFAFQTDLEMKLVEEIRRSEKHGVLRMSFAKPLGKPVPDWGVRDANGKKASLRALAAGRVTVVAIFLARGEGFAALPWAGLSSLSEAHRNFGEGLARPGRTWVPNAKPD